jgi:hypothetical protein
VLLVVPLEINIHNENKIKSDTTGDSFFITL